MKSTGCDATVMITQTVPLDRLGQPLTPLLSATGKTGVTLRSEALGQGKLQHAQCMILSAPPSTWMRGQYPTETLDFVVLQIFGLN